MDEVKEREKNIKEDFRWMPVAFSLNRFGFWLSSRRISYPLLRKGYEEEALKRGHLFVPHEYRNIYSLKEWAYLNGWVKFLYNQSNSFDRVNFQDDMIRKLYIYIYPYSGVLLDYKMFKSITEVINFYEEFFYFDIYYIIKIIDFEDNVAYVKQEEKFLIDNNLEQFLQRIRDSIRIED